MKKVAPRWHSNITFMITYVAFSTLLTRSGLIVRIITRLIKCRIKIERYRKEFIEVFIGCWKERVLCVCIYPIYLFP